MFSGRRAFVNISISTVSQYQPITGNIPVFVYVPEGICGKAKVVK
jgi:hypothetical protein